MLELVAHAEHHSNYAPFELRAIAALVQVCATRLASFRSYATLATDTNTQINFISFNIMDQLFTDLIGKPQRNGPKIITIIAENFSFIEDQARFLKAIFAIPKLKRLSLSVGTLLQIGPLHCEVREQLDKLGWDINEFDETSEDICDQINHSQKLNDLLFINDASRLHLTISDDPPLIKNLIRVIHNFKLQNKYSVIVLYQNSLPQSKGTFLRDLECLSDAMIRAKSFKGTYVLDMWFQPDVQRAVLIPPKVETIYYACKIGRSYWSNDLLCFYDKKKVHKNYDPNRNAQPDEDDSCDKKPIESLGRITLDDTDETERSPTLPYTRAQDPELSRIFYYPDKDDDIDEDDPDSDLNI